MRLRFLPLVFALALAGPASAHPLESCAAQAPTAPESWTLDLLGSLGATSVYQSGRDGGFVNRSRSEWGLDGAHVLRTGSEWNVDAEAWEAPGSRDVIEFIGANRHDVARYTFRGRATPADPFADVQRDVMSYDANGFLVEDRRQNWTGSTWVDNRRAAYERHASGAFRAIRFERWDGSAWALDYRTSTAFDAAGRRVLCEYFGSDDAAATPYRRYRTHYGADGRPAAVVREDFGDDVAPHDSSAYVYDDQGRYQSLVGHELTATGWTVAGRTSVVFDASGAVVEQLAQRPGWAGWLDVERVRFTYRDDGLLETQTTERVISGSWSTRGRYTYTSERRAIASEATPGLALKIVASPNPTLGLAEVRLAFAHADHLRLDVYDLTGRVVVRVHDGAVSAGPARLALDLRGLPAGTYLIVARTRGGQSTATVTVAR